MFDLILERINKIDVQMNGFLLDLTGLGNEMASRLLKTHLDINFMINFNELGEMKREGPLEELVYLDSINR